ncbi:hypothetical protein ABZ897_58610 [Nonomuraea sp. NPDC046802]|uniref:hypothetical protein n=1 Tax=Nonomuraea sp. NPDC046802 TaxID=3154919 RepID=UPI0033D9951F
MLLPVEAAAVWQRHLAEQEAEHERRAREKALGERLPATDAPEDVRQDVSRGAEGASKGALGEDIGAVVADRPQQ